MNWTNYLMEDEHQIKQILQETRSIAVLGIKPESRQDQPAFYVPRYLQNAGYKIYPVPVYFPEVTQILGEPVHRSLLTLPEADLALIFRRPADIAAHLPELLTMRFKTVWMQSGITQPEVAQILAESGTGVVQNHCMMVEHRRLLPTRPSP